MVAGTVLQPSDLRAGNGLAEVLLNDRQNIPNTRNGYCTGIFFGGKTRDFADESKSLNPAMRSGSVYAACSPGSWPGKLIFYSMILLIDIIMSGFLSIYDMMRGSSMYNKDVVHECHMITPMFVNGWGITKISRSQNLKLLTKTNQNQVHGNYVRHLYHTQNI